MNAVHAASAWDRAYTRLNVFIVVIGLSPCWGGEPPIRLPSTVLSDGLAKIREAERLERPENNTVFVKTSGTGTGEFVVSNGTQLDAIVNLVSTATFKKFLSVYVRSGETATVPQIRSNSYVIVFAQGKSYSQKTRFFGEFVRAAKFSEVIYFPRVSDQPTGQNTVWKITLHPTLQGDAKTDELTMGSYFNLAK